MAFANNTVAVTFSDGEGYPDRSPFSPPKVAWLLLAGKMNGLRYKFPR